MIVPAFGRGTRMGTDKLWVEVAGRPLLFHTLCALGAGGIDAALVVVAPSERWVAVRRLAAEAGFTRITLAEGGARRQDSVRAALGLTEGCAVVAVHDAARALCPPTLLPAVVAAAAEHGAATVAIPVVDSIKRVDRTGRVLESLDRAELVAVQTPQAFRRDLLVEAHRLALVHGWLVDDDCALVERAGAAVVTVPGHPSNLKVTTPADLGIVRSRFADATPEAR
ncbi:MAG TPA: 2-C-methyl-D-erythritol 4-phosphate cytidylyltransferase [Candidatus Dormibacteraeota bacterium]|nr:2-C-methyl-D-erythritol 4-phosphate cytidylyltransferase [Candidatus Dormibacteraeota bacterium]